ncbi:class I SAM-dependent methyltransferase [Pseudobacter ginsenosidimutans]|uniref:Methyltransferase family protein n=1 Tax=Pseudobacter ginsenosidimutans TaxID=661488 RepID=A0A4Q7N2E8_9BACT|nr:class I SAM-dependent methyltransferase [Pseudobacter ginsenosidimutans]QEC44091.1 class I SAM-dependent methyltransferase [Pseudobacter ginsenosidimutans]RZS75532.1 methyltransferase family protein [Pseudobacter ginsenosidimutans]
MDSTKRFSNRVEDYVKYRPHYPGEIVSFLADQYDLSADKIIADIGAGTGISSKPFLEEGYKVIAVEPNKEMLDKAIELLGDYPEFSPVSGTAEKTTLKAHSVDAIIAGQAFHWFNREKCKTEFRRILKNAGLLAVIWNERLIESPFEVEYDALIVKHARDYVKVDHRNINMEDMVLFFDPAPVELNVFSNKQVFDFEGLKGRLLSSSYMPVKGEDGYETMVEDLELLFDRFKENELIVINYATKVYSGIL